MKCSQKIRFLTKRDAVTARNMQWERYHAERKVYNCPECGKWHLTSRSEEKEYKQSKKP